MDPETAVEKFKTILKEEPDVSPAIAALTVLSEVLDKDPSETIQGLGVNLKAVEKAFMGIENVVTSVKSSCELFMRFITLTSLDHSDFKDCKKVMSDRGKMFLDNAKKARERIAKMIVGFIREKKNILVHSHSRVVYEALVEIHKAKTIHVYVSESAPDYSGRRMYEKLKKAGISCTLIIDAAISFIMERIDTVLLGADGVVENGGIINKIGTYGLALTANKKKRKIFVLAECFKFLRIFPVNQRDLANEIKRLDMNIDPPECSLIDYTPPEYITLLFTDLGILTTAAVSEELIKLYV